MKILFIFSLWKKENRGLEAVISMAIGQLEWRDLNPDLVALKPVLSSLDQSGVKVTENPMTFNNYFGLGLESGPNYTESDPLLA